MVFIHCSVDPFVPGQAATFGQRFQIRLVTQRTLGLSFEKLILSEPEQLLVSVTLVELNNLLESADRGFRAEGSQVGIEIGL